jgi:superfamily II DNA helicase RecQ
MKQVRQDIMDNKTKLLFIAPETLTKEENIEFFKQVNLSFVAVDEAHCISEWGHDFRPEYRRIRAMLDSIGGDIPVVALTATATPKVQSDIVKNLNMTDHNTFISSFNRENLYYEVRPKLKKEQTLKQIVQIIKEIPDQSGIIYVQSRKSAAEIAGALKVNDIKAAPYHAGLDAKPAAKRRMISSWKKWMSLWQRLLLAWGLTSRMCGLSSTTISQRVLRTTIRRPGVPGGTGWKAAVSRSIPTKIFCGWKSSCATSL